MSWLWVDTKYKHTPSTAYTEYSIHRVQHTPSTAYTEYSIHRVQHTTQDCLTSLYSHDYELTPECRISFRRASLQDRLPSASSPWELNSKVTLSYSHVCDSTNWWIESQHPARRPSTGSKYSFNLARSRPPKWNSILARLRPPCSHDLGLQVYLQTHSIMISECISKFYRSQPPSVSPNTLDYRHQVHLQTGRITDSKYISKLARSRSQSASLSSFDHGFQVYLQIRSITTSRCISKHAGSWLRSVSMSLLDLHFQVHLKFLSCSDCRASRDTLCVDG